MKDKLKTTLLVLLSWGNQTHICKTQVENFSFQYCLIQFRSNVTHADLYWSLLSHLQMHV